MSNEYFVSSLNYTLANEDTGLELELLPQGVGHLFSVAGSGGRILPLLARAPKVVTCVDISQEQLHLARMRFESARVLTHAEFMRFWGYPPQSADPAERRKMFESLSLPDDARTYLSKVFEARGWESILYDGKWERTFGKLSVGVRALTGAAGMGLFTALTRAEHERYLREKFPARAWKTVLFLLGNAGVFNALLYKGHFPKKNLPQSFYGFYKEAFERLFAQGPARENFFLQLLFFGKVIFSEGCPVECKPEVFAAAQAALRSGIEIRYRLGDLVGEAASTDVPIDFFSFSDVPSYFSGDLEREFMQRVRPKLAGGALVVLRNYLHVPEGLDLSGYDTVTAQYREAIAREKLQVYTTEIYRKSS